LFINPATLTRCHRDAAACSSIFFGLASLNTWLVNQAHAMLLALAAY